MEDKTIQVGFKMLESRKNIIKSRASAQGKDMQKLFDDMIDKYFAENPMTNAERAIVKSTLVEDAKAE